jgi:hypothetical protein
MNHVDQPLPQNIHTPVPLLGFRIFRRLVGLALGTTLFLALFIHFAVAVSHEPWDSIYGLPFTVVMAVVMASIAAAGSKQHSESDHY